MRKKLTIHFKLGESSTLEEQQALAELTVRLLGAGSKLVCDHSALCSIYHGLEFNLIKVAKALQERNWREEALLFIPESWGPEEHLLTLVEKIEAVSIGNL